MVDSYFYWMCSLIDPHRKNFIKDRIVLLEYLYDSTFEPMLPMDENRAQDGIDLRYRYGDIFHHKQAEICACLDNKPCSVLEMMVALCLRCEDIMTNNKYGDRTSKWFWSMIKSLGLYKVKNDIFDNEIVDYCLSRFMNRTYDYDGKGGLFHIPGINRDMRSIEIWYQAMWYLDDILEAE